MADLEERIKMFLKLEQEQDHDVDGGGDTFAERAEWFFKKRPQLLALLHDLYNGYIALLDRCTKMEGKHKRHSSLISSSAATTICPDEEIIDSWDVESSISYQQTPIKAAATLQGSSNIDDEIVAHLVMKNVEEDLLKSQLLDMENQFHESSRKIDLLKKLLEVLESERMLLLNENARLGYQVAGLLEQNQGLSSEVMFLKNKAAQLARCVLKMREDHRVCLLTRKIEDLQCQIYGLEKRNQEYYQQLLMKEKPEKEERPSRRNINNGGLMGCFQMESIKFKKRNGADEVSVKKNDAGPRRVPKWWEKVKKTIANSSSSSFY